MEQRKTNKDQSVSGDFERRYISHEVRAIPEDSKMEIQGVASKYGVLYDMGWFLERVEHGALDGADSKDCKCLFNHDQSLVLGAVSSNTLFISETNEIRYKSTLPDTTVAKDTYTLISRGDIDKSSFGFTVKEQRWEEVDRSTLKDTISEDVLDRVSYGGKVTIRSIVKIKKLYDVSPVTFPANPDTTVAKRSFDALHRSDEVPTPSEVKGEAIDSVTSLIEALNDVVCECDDFINSAPNMALLDSENAAMYTELATSCATVKEAAKEAIGLQAGFISNVNSQRNKILLVDMDLRLMEMQESL
jgi:HK97 family phage prohead protease